MIGTRRLGLLAVAWLAGLMFAHRSILAILPRNGVVDPIEAFFFDTRSTVPVLHLALAAFVLFHRRHAIEACLSEKGAPSVGTLAATLGIAFLAWAQFTKQIDLEIDSLMLVLAGSGLILGGPRLLERLVLPLTLLWLARPIPPMLAHHLHEWLQRFTGSFAQALLSPFSPVERSGHLLFFQGRLFEVIEGCSGLRLELTLITATLVYLDFISRSRRQTLSVLLLAVVLGPILNGLRVVSIMLNPMAEVSQVHSTQGLIFISFGVATVALLDRLLERRCWPPSPAASPPIARRDPAAASPQRLVGVAALAVACITVSILPYDRPRQLESASWALHEVRPQLGKWRRTRALELDRDFLGSVKFGNKLYWEFTRENDSGIGRVFVASDDRRRRDRSSFSQKTRLLGTAWEIKESVRVQIDTPPFAAERSIQESRDERWLSLHYRIGEVSLLEASARWYVAIDLRPAILPGQLITVRIEVPIDERNPAVALTRLHELQAEVGRALVRAAPPARP
ncbi:MAG: hypothetical protein CL908_12850 [Deltaproteobacteria bacterium]|nr:hypothetical protein [Deltaproteobacteria bacterium]